MRRTWAVTAAVLLMGSTAAVASPAHPTTSGRLAGTTAIAFHGNAAIRLSAPRTMLRGGDLELRMKSGTYAFIRLVQPDEPGCEASVGPKCYTFQFDWVKGFTDWNESSPPERQHTAIVTDPPRITGPRLDFYVFSDGAGEVTIQTALPARTQYRAGGHVIGRASPLPLGCSAGCGREDSTTFRYGGIEYDLGRQGWAQVLVVSRNRDVNSGNGFSGTEACLMPNPASPSASSSPEDHPYGCGLPPYPTQREYVDAGFGAATFAAGMTPSSSTGQNVWWTAAKGRQYMGGRAFATGVEARTIQVFAIAFRYGIS